MFRRSATSLLSLLALLFCAMDPVSSSALDLVERTTVTNPTPKYKDYFGAALARVGADRFIVGAPGEISYTNYGFCCIYDSNGNQMLTITNPAPAAGDGFGHAIAVLGNDRLVIAAYADEGLYIDTGSVYLYDTNGNLLVTVTNPAPTQWDHFGQSVAAIGTSRFVVCAMYDDTGAGEAGCAYLYDRSGTLLRTVTNPAPESGDCFGISVSGVGTDRFVVGSSYDDMVETNSGTAYLYDFDGNLLLVITNPTPSTNDYFGAAVAAVDSNLFAVSAVLDDNGPGDAGAVYLYDLDGNLLLTITNPAGQAWDWFGSAIAPVGDGRLLIGAEAGSYNNTGAAWIFSRCGQLLTNTINPMLDWDAGFGHAVCGVSTDRFVVGTPYSYSGGSGDNHKQGYVYVCRFQDGRTYYVNDGFTNNDAWCSAIGSDTNTGTNAASPKASVQSVLASYDLEPRDRIYVDTGLYSLTNNIVLDAADAGSSCGGLVLLQGSPNGALFDRASTNAGHYGLLLTNADFVRVVGLAFTGGYYGIYLNHSDLCSVSNVAIRHAGSRGIHTWYSDGNEFRDVDVSGCGAGGIRWGMDSDNNVLSHGIVWSNAGPGVSAAAALGVAWSRSNRVEQSTLAWNRGGQIYVTSLGAIRARNNILAAAGASNYCIHWVNSYIDGSGSYAGDFNDLFAEGGASVGLFETWDPMQTNFSAIADWRAWSGSDSNSIAEDPLFVDNTSDFHLRSSAENGSFVTALASWTNFPGENSPAIDAGDPTNSCALEPAWNGGFLNLGAYGDTPFASRSVDGDGDTLSDTFEQYRFGSSPADEDSDDDGASDLHEFIAGTIPTDEDSFLCAGYDAALVGPGERFVIHWPSAAGRTYSISRYGQLDQAPSSVISGIPATPTVNSYTVTVTGLDREMYQVGARR